MFLLHLESGAVFRRYIKKCNCCCSLFLFSCDNNFKHRLTLTLACLIDCSSVLFCLLIAVNHWSLICFIGFEIIPIWNKFIPKLEYLNNLDPREEKLFYLNKYDKKFLLNVESLIRLEFWENFQYYIYIFSNSKAWNELLEHRNDSIQTGTIFDKSALCSDLTSDIANQV